MQHQEISFDVSDEEKALIAKIAQRAQDYAHSIGHKLLWTDLMLDLAATHANGNPLRLREMADADNFNFVHDIFGIMKHINRETGQLMDGFRPRFSQPKTREAA